MSSIDLSATIEAILFTAGEPVDCKTLAKLTDASLLDINSALDSLNKVLQGRGVRLIRDKQVCQLVTSPQAEASVAAFLATQVRRDLSQPALETLAIVAYHQPITRSRIEEIRGVASEQTIRGLVARELISGSGKSNAPGKPILYATTTQFLQYFGLSNADELPPLEKAL